jgi:hypothetical protein
LSKNKTERRPHSPPSEVLLQDICCITDNVALTAAAVELNYLKGIGVGYVQPKSKYELIRVLSEKGGNVLHLVCLDRPNKRQSGGWAIQLPDGGSFKPADLNQKSISDRIREKRPLVFFNVYQSSGEGSMLIGIEEWAKRFIDFGCGAMIGCVWDVDSPLASEFAVHLYQGLIGGSSLGQSIRASRKEIIEKKSTSWLAYYLYGSPNFRLSLGGLNFDPLHDPARSPVFLAKELRPDGGVAGNK